MNPDEPINVLLLEDDAEDRLLLTKQLHGRQRGFVISCAGTLKSAIELLGRQSFDVVITDLSVPDSHGFETVSRIRKHSGQAPVIVLTGMDDDLMAGEILAIGAQDYLVKGQLDERAVQRAVRHAVQRQRLVNDVQQLASELGASRQALEEQSQLLKKKNRRLKRLYRAGQEIMDNVSHDFRTPLTVIKDYVSIIRAGMAGAVNEEQQAMLDKVIVRADDLNLMVDDLLDVSRLEAGLIRAWRRRIRLTEVVQRAASMLHQRADTRRVEFLVDCPEDLPDVYGDADQIGRIITNLAVNAIKFSGTAGRVVLRAKYDEANREVVVSVADNGPGIDEKSLEQIFERFSQLSNGTLATNKGHGLGLNIAHQFARINLGELKVQSRVGQGSEFSFSTPIADPAEALRRWLALYGMDAQQLRVVHISVANDCLAPSSNEFDSFLYCLLRRDDLLYRTSRCEWLLVMASPPSESNRWFERAEEEFVSANRNRPFGPLPDYRAEAYCEWDSLVQPEEAVRQFAEIARQSSAASALVSSPLVESA